MDVFATEVAEDAETERTKAKMSKATCPNCGEQFAKIGKDGKIPSHDFPKPCRSVCRGSGQDPKHDPDTPLWKDDSQQEAKDFFDGALTELRLYGFAVVKQMATFAGKSSGTTECPLCGGVVKYRVAESNGHCAAKCERKGCIHAME